MSCGFSGGAIQPGRVPDWLQLARGREGLQSIALASDSVERDRASADYLRVVAAHRLAAGRHPNGAQRIERVYIAGLLHEVGYTVSHLSFHKHGAYILEHADMPGFSSQEQRRLAWLVLGCRGGLTKIAPLLGDMDTRALLIALRLAVIFHRARGPVDLPRIALEVRKSIAFGVPARWLKSHPLTAHLLAKERDEWTALGHPWKSA